MSRKYKKVQHKFLTKSSKVLMLYQHSFHHQLPWHNLEHSKVSCLSFSLPIVKFFYEFAEGVNEIDDGPSPSLKFQINFIEMSARYGKWKRKWLFSRLYTISFFRWSLRIDFNCYILLDACIWVALCIKVPCCSMRAFQLASTFWV